ncbi:phthiocerol/phthiodiolone dimycocerosyl transferase family protein [Streptomyces mirabilis]|uniref:phthiocerol/phthiodiolone dimycocerosyl transferase family protein n=1 Tax=Streptomyces mirabilis TaxID=68239 RepID=UPI0033BBC62F
MTPLRRLSDVEAAFARTHALMHGTTQVTTQVTVRGDLDPQHFRRGAERWAAELPLLSLRIEERPDGLWFTTGPGPRPGQIRHDPLGAPDSPDDVLRRELNDVLETGGPLWRLRLVRDPDAGASHLYFTRNHAISDGHSTGAVVRALLDALFASTDGVSVHDVRTLPPNGDALTYRPPAPPDAPVGESVPRPDPLPFEAHRPWDERAADFVPLAFTREESLALKSWCRERGVTVNQFFAVALAESYAEATGRSEVNLCTAVSLRRRYEESAELPDVGCFINILNVPVRVGRGDPAEEARDYAAALARADAAWRPPLRDHALIRRAVAETAAARSATGICITNVGVVDPALGPHTARVTGYRTVVNRAGANYAVVLHLGTLGGAFTTALAFGTPSTDPDTVRAVAKALRDRALRPAAARRDLSAGASR